VFFDFVHSLDIQLQLRTILATWIVLFLPSVQERPELEQKRPEQELKLGQKLEQE